MVKKDCVIVIDSREQHPLEFSSREIKTTVEALDVGDYAIRIQGRLADIRIERKGLGDLFSSFSGDNYLKEKDKIHRAKTIGAKYVLAIEGTCSDVRKGYSYSKGGVCHESGKSGLSQVRQLMTLSRKYGIEVWYCADRSDMSFRVQEYLTTPARIDP